MAKETEISFCDSTVSPVMGCTLQCPLWPSKVTLQQAVTTYLIEQHGLEEHDARGNTKSAVEEWCSRTTSDVYYYSDNFAFSVLSQTKLLTDELLDVQPCLEKFIKAQFRCYAGILHLRHGHNPTKREKAVSDGYAADFQKPELFSGRVQVGAAWSNLKDKSRPSKPWLNRLPRLILISDQGDALSEEISLDEIRSEIIDPILSPKGRRHWWLWATRNAQGLNKVSRFLSAQGIPWPVNLVPLLSVSCQYEVNQLSLIRNIPAAVRAVWAQPVLEPLDLNLERIDWLIVGGEGGANASPLNLEWVREIKAQCGRGGTAIFISQLGANLQRDKNRNDSNDPHCANWGSWPEDLRFRSMPRAFLDL